MAGGLNLARVELNHLSKEESNAAVDFLRSKYQSGLSVRGSRVDVQTPTDRELRMQVLKFLRSRRLDDYRVVSETGQIEVLPPKPEHAHSKVDKRKTASPYSTMPYYFQDSTVVKPPRKKK